MAPTALYMAYFGAVSGDFCGGISEGLSGKASEKYEEMVVICSQ